MGLRLLGLHGDSRCIFYKKGFFSFLPLFFLARKESHVRTNLVQALRGAKRRRQTLKPPP